MTKYQVCELEGVLLDAAVAKALEHSFEISGGFVRVNDWQRPGSMARGNPFDPSTNWRQGGPIIEREHIGLEGRDRNGRPHGEWAARIHFPRVFFGPTPLIAAMRAFVGSKFGEEVELS